MDKILDIISKWDHVGQGFFFLCVIGIIVGGIISLMKGLIILMRGYPDNSKQIKIDD